ncbi:Bet v I/Major latex protein [Dillenia turbinata]|uniref:Bet v I/Major latex protein n=1 Tax=Dillenia turbinata TaxID=194707 RepID=A0AAN8V9V3_9MAGN
MFGQWTLWELVRTPQLAKLIEEELSDLINNIELVEGDGGEGTVLKITFPPDTPGFSVYKEKFTKVDNEKRVKEPQVVEGGHLNLGFTMYLVRLEVIEKGVHSCILKITIEYDLKEESAANASMVSIQPLAMIADVVAKRLIQNKA